jgi:superfamily I DNA/RNA helicase
LSDARELVANSSNNLDAVWSAAESFLKELGLARLASLSADYESRPRLNELITETHARLRSTFEMESDVCRALKLLATGFGVRILTIHKCKGLEFDSVVILGVEKETFWGKVADERCAYFIGISRAKERLLLTYAAYRKTPFPRPKVWNEVRIPHKEFLDYASPFVNPAK